MAANGSIAVTGNLLLSIKECGRRFSYGDRIRFSSTLHIPRNFSNPGGFDYIRHLAYKSIYATAFLESDESITLIREGDGNRFLVFIESIRNRIRECIISSTRSPSRDILLALIIGEQGTIPEHIRQRFSALGITHILSISGLHVSIFALLAYGIIFNLLKLYPRLLLYIPAKKIAAFHVDIPGIGVLHDCRHGHTGYTVGTHGGVLSAYPAAGPAAAHAAHFICCSIFYSCCFSAITF